MYLDRSFYSFYMRFVYFWLRWVFLAVCGRPPVVESHARASRCSGFSLCRAPALGTQASAVVVPRLSCSKPCRILVPRLGIKPTSPALAGRVLTAGSPGKSLSSLQRAIQWHWGPSLLYNRHHHPPPEQFSLCIAETLYPWNRSSAFSSPSSPWKLPPYFLSLWFWLSQVPHISWIIGLFHSVLCSQGSSPGDSMVKSPPANAEDGSSIPGLGGFPGEENGNPLQYSCLENPWTEEPGGLQSMGSQRAGHNSATKQPHSGVIHVVAVVRISLF